MKVLRPDIIYNLIDSIEENKIIYITAFSINIISDGIY